MGPIWLNCREYLMAHNNRAFKSQAVQLVLTPQKIGAPVARARGIPSKTWFWLGRSDSADLVEPLVGGGA
jgi:transposase-like protein